MNEKINLTDLVNLLSGKAGISKKEAEVFLKEWFLSMEEGLFEDQVVKMKKLGMFKLTPIKDRESIDVTTGGKLLIPAHYKVTFIPDKDFAEIINEPFALFQPEEINDDVDEKDIIEKDDRVEDTEKETLIKKQFDIEDVKKEEKIEIPDELFVQYNFQAPGRKKRRKTKVFRRKTLIPLLALFLLAGIGYVVYEFVLSNSNFDSGLVRSQDIKTPVQQEGTSLVLEKSIPAVQDEAPVTPEEQLPIKEEPLKKRTIQEGERLTTVALEEYGNKYFWVYIYEENKATIANPDRIKIGQEVIIPPATKYSIDKNNPESVRKAKEINDRF
jgi:Bacterial nucleoid DNA-binding protein